MKSIISSILIASLIIVLNGCKRIVEYNFLQSTDNITKVEIVIVKENKAVETASPSDIQQETILQKELSDIEYNNLIQDLKNIDCFKRVTDPGYMFDGTEAIKINYSNGDYELIGVDAQASYQNSRYVRTGYYYFNNAQFNELLSKYINKN